MFNMKWFAGSWGLFKHGTIEPITTWDSISELSVDFSSTVTSYPVERNSFSTVNKVSTPTAIKVQLIKTLGILSDIATAQFTEKYYSTYDTIEDLKALRNSADLIDIESPHGVYIGYALTGLSYSHTASEGGYMLIADLSLEEVREAGDWRTKEYNLDIFSDTTPVCRVQGQAVDSLPLKFTPNIDNATIIG